MKSRIFNIMQLALIFLLFVSIAAVNCHAQERKSRQIVGPVKDPKKVELDLKEFEKKINAAKQSLSYWIRANTYYPIVPSVAAVAVEDDSIVFQETVRCDPTTQFMVASITKTFTAIAILQLAERRVLSLNDPIQKYLHVNFENPELNSEKITIWHLLTHTSGLIEDPNPKQEKENYPFMIPLQKFPTGYRFNYCNQGYNLLGYIVFEASGLNLGEYVTRYILTPMEMKDSKAPSSTRGAAGIMCSINDLSKYLIMFLHNGVYKKKRIISKRMFSKIINETIEAPPSMKKEYRGLCFRIWTIGDRVYSMHHAAHMPGAGGFMQMFPQHKNGYVFLSNPPVYDCEEYYGYYYGIKSGMVRFCKALMQDGFDPVNFQPDRPSREQMSLYVGRYVKRSDSGSQYIDIELHPGGYLIATKSYTGMRYVIISTSLHTFVYIYPGQSEKGEIFDFILKKGQVIGLGVKEGFFAR